MSNTVWEIMGALEKELFSHNMRPPAKSKSLSSIIWAVDASQISYLFFFLNGIPVCVLVAGLLDKDLENSAVNRCTIPRRAFGFCHMLLKGNKK